MQTETWKSVVGYEDEYEVSDMGKIRAKPRILKARVNASGHAEVELKGKRECVHHLVLEAFAGPSALRYHRRKNGDKLDNRAENLSWVQQVAVAERSASNAPRLTAEAVAAMRRDLADGMPIRTAGRKYGVAPKTVRDIRDGRTWKDAKSTEIDDLIDDLMG